MGFRLLLAGLSLAAALLVAAPALAAPNAWRRAHPLNIAHQGGEDELPSNTMYAFRRAVRAGADMLELDIGVTKDGHVVVRHDTTVDSSTDGTGTVASYTLARLQRLDGAYWFIPGRAHFDHGRPASAYRLRGIATGRRRPPRGFTARDFRIPTLREVLRVFPHTPINVEIKGRTKTEALEEYLANARVLARELRGLRRRDVIVVSFKQPAVELFHRLAPRLPVAPGVEGAANFLLTGGSPGAGVVVFQLPITYLYGGSMVDVTTPATVANAHRAGYAWQTWFGDEDRDAPATWRNLIAWCVDGIMTSRPIALEKTLRATRSPAACRP